MKELILGAIVSLFLLVGCSAGDLSLPTTTTSKSKIDPTCAQLFVTVVGNPDASTKGLWNCLALSSQEDYYTRLGWKDDVTVSKFLKDHFGEVKQHTDSFYMNPVPYCLKFDANNNCADNEHAFLFRLALIEDDGTYDLTAASSTGFTVVVDNHGKIIEIQ